MTQARLSDALPCIAAALQFSLPWPGGTAIKINYGGARAGLLLPLCCIAQLHGCAAASAVRRCTYAQAASHRHPRCLAHPAAVCPAHPAATCLAHPAAAGGEYVGADPQAPYGMIVHDVRPPAACIDASGGMSESC